MRSPMKIWLRPWINNICTGAVWIEEQWDARWRPSSECLRVLRRGEGFVHSRVRVECDDRHAAGPHTDANHFASANARPFAEHLVFLCAYIQYTSSLLVRVEFYIKFIRRLLVTINTGWNNIGIKRGRGFIGERLVSNLS